MTVGTAGLTGRAEKAVHGRLSFEDQIFLTRHVEEAEKITKEIRLATEAYNHAAERHGKADQIDNVLAEARASKEAADAEMTEAQKRASIIVSQAKSDAEEIVAKANAALNNERAGVKELREQISAKEKTLTEKEAKIDPTFAQAEKALEEANAMKTEAENTQSVYKKRTRKLEDALAKLETTLKEV